MTKFCKITQFCIDDIILNKCIYYSDMKIRVNNTLTQKTTKKRILVSGVLPVIEYNKERHGTWFQ
jgi:hypothetical protein